MNAVGLFAIIRPVNSIVAGLATTLGFLIATGMLRSELVALILTVTCITAAGNVINDYFDIEMDAVNRPDRPIPAGEVSRQEALVYAGALFFAGIGLSLFTNPLCIAIALLNSALLILYAAYLKRTPLIGNLTVSYLSASIFLFGGAFAGVSGFFMNIPIAVITLLAMMARELLKAAEDIAGDAAGGAVTVPMIIGVQSTAVMALFFVIVAVSVSLMPIIKGWGIPYIMAIGAVDLVLIGGAARALGCRSPECVRSRGATRILKAGMFTALLVFVLAAVFLA
jgi:geranylgeranylglycerol-phosphate geranylgeranyltransferase